MDCKFVSDTVNICGSIFDSAAEHSIDTEITLPDYCPDIGKILKCQAFPQVLSKSYTEQKITVEGVTLVRVIYTDDKGKCVRSYEQEYPFMREFSVKEPCDSAEISVTCKPDYVNCRAITQRKIDIHGAFSIIVRGVCEQKYDVIADAKGAGIKLKNNIISSNSLTMDVSSGFTVNETCELPNGKPPIGTVIRSEAFANVLETKAISGKLILRGEVILHLLYAGDLDAEKLETMEFSVPVSQFIDIENLDETCTCDVKLRNNGIKLSLKTDSDGEYRIISTDIRLEAEVRVYKPTNLSLVSDCYSTEYELNTESRQFSLDMLENAASESIVHKATIDTASGFVEVMDVWCMAGECSCQKGEGGTKIVCPAVICLLGKNSDGSIVYVEKNTEINYSSSVSFEYSTVEAHIAVSNVSYNFVSGQLEVRINAQLSVLIFNHRMFNVITAITPDEARPKNSDNRPAMTVYFGEKGETLWDIAMEHNSSVESIMAENDLAEDVLSEDKMLLIS